MARPVDRGQRHPTDRLDKFGKVSFVLLMAVAFVFMAFDVQAGWLMVGWGVAVAASLCCTNLVRRID